MKHFNKAMWYNKTKFDSLLELAEKTLPKHEDIKLLDPNKRKMDSLVLSRPDF